MPESLNENKPPVPAEPGMKNQIVVDDYRRIDKILDEERTYLLNIVTKIKKAKSNVLSSKIFGYKIFAFAKYEQEQRMMIGLNVYKDVNIRELEEFRCRAFIFVQAMSPSSFNFENAHGTPYVLADRDA
ncbi:uncharacterized protein MCYG_07839 [Microsporum canis CBS 113480]|uniref:Uncharacterized protein n=1 Tax=Arthroderma otae (strain ATCC MYA-4605 / CBS 113480) TaxID=554155 RepID=C5FXI0_ARTOC|nr:uncharacterized protein MCYG_07839 [Microsporum canis CBS 113480]EEQ35020.1 predicted protein [Microsporum canis CBS 113480]